MEALACRVYTHNRLIHNSALSRTGVLPDESAEVPLEKAIKGYPDVTCVKEPLISRGKHEST